MEKDNLIDFFEKFLKSKILFYSAVCLLVLKILIFLLFVNFPDNIFFADITKTDFVNMLNETRESFGLYSLAESQSLDQAAEMKAEDMVQKQYFSHVSPQGLTPWHWFLQSGYNYKYAGENLAIGFYDSKEAFNAWLNSPSHRENILNKNYKEVGTAVLDGFGPNNAIVAVQLFGAQLPEKVLANVNNDNTNENLLQENNQDVILQQETTEEENSLSANNTDADSKKVLPGATTLVSLEPLKNNTSDDLYSRFLNFIAYDYNAIIQDIIYGLLTVVTGILLFALLFDFNAYTQKKFIFRAFIVIILLSSATLFDRELIISIIPHQIII
ncbi:MAG: hypothetical protein A2812_03015 [Candidatus Staskawiczbacteria bacterium RIFCSPHIGHO2_01_FULL_36_16]|uniref:SCP domain-containing protein n=1 Tax=Candidatus Staskawiczbacteria bacterium RIFCSPHIGHO2_01_FULL_36_16 TaxID=1802200 RepID=A0A1G2HJG1_9BACT|nr:MAG: hypothetical protein A2812_03015 [Candidatus Staskawiczbacteria bacterium RIFCSPHIGHO2_01_FULL_36_16]